MPEYVIGDIVHTEGDPQSMGKVVIIRMGARLLKIRTPDKQYWLNFDKAVLVERAEKHNSW